MFGTRKDEKTRNFHPPSKGLESSSNSLTKFYRTQFLNLESGPGSWIWCMRPRFAPCLAHDVNRPFLIEGRLLTYFSRAETNALRSFLIICLTRNILNTGIIYTYIMSNVLVRRVSSPSSPMKSPGAPDGRVSNCWILRGP